jgi:hypothetical protein
MQKKIILGSILVLLLAVPGVSLAFAGGDEHGEGDDNDVRTFKVTLRHGPDTDHELDLGASGLSVGDRFIFATDAFRKGERVGVGAGDCVTVRFRPGRDQPQAHNDLCVATLSLPEGQITAQGLFDRITGPVPVTLAITGGTGAYRTAHGELLSPGPDAEGDEVLTLRVILDD